MKTVILAGGSGSRLWPLTQTLPKQFLELGMSSSLLTQTVERMERLVARSDILIVAKTNFPLLSFEGIEVILEPTPRSTLPAILLAVKHLIEKGVSLSEVCLITPSDHLIEPLDLFVKEIKEAVESAKTSKEIISFGVNPLRAEIGFGYIKKGELLSDNSFFSKKFVEKPSLTLAEEYVKSGEYLWNTGIYLFRLDTFLKHLEQTAPLFFSAQERGLACLLQGFSELPSISIDYGLIEKVDKTRVMTLQSSWSDVGSWDQVYELMIKDEQGNATQGSSKLINVKNCLVISQKKQIALLDVEDLYVIETEEAILITKKGSSQKVKELVQALVKKEDFS